MRAFSLLSLPQRLRTSPCSGVSTAVAPRHASGTTRPPLPRRGAQSAMARLHRPPPGAAAAAARNSSQTALPASVVPQTVTLPALPQQPLAPPVVRSARRLPPRPGDAATTGSPDASAVLVGSISSVATSAPLDTAPTTGGSSYSATAAASMRASTSVPQLLAATHAEPVVASAFSPPSALPRFQSTHTLAAFNAGIGVLPAPIVVPAPSASAQPSASTTAGAPGAPGATKAVSSEGTSPTAVAFASPTCTEPDSGTSGQPPAATSANPAHTASATTSAAADEASGSTTAATAAAAGAAPATAVPSPGSPAGANAQASPPAIVSVAEGSSGPPAPSADAGASTNKAASQPAGAPAAAAAAPNAPTAPPVPLRRPNSCPGRIGHTPGKSSTSHVLGRRRTNRCLAQQGSGPVPSSPSASATAPSPIVVPVDPATASQGGASTGNLMKQTLSRGPLLVLPEDDEEPAEDDDEVMPLIRPGALERLQRRRPSMQVGGAMGRHAGLGLLPLAAARRDALTVAQIDPFACADTSTAAAAGNKADRIPTDGVAASSSKTAGVGAGLSSLPPITRADVAKMIIHPRGRRGLPPSVATPPACQTPPAPASGESSSLRLSRTSLRAAGPDSPKHAATSDTRAAGADSTATPQAEAGAARRTLGIPMRSSGLRHRHRLPPGGIQGDRSRTRE